MACLLGRVLMADRGAAREAWSILRSCLLAACRTDPAAVVETVAALFEQGDYGEVCALV